MNRKVMRYKPLKEMQMVYIENKFTKINGVDNSDVKPSDSLFLILSNNEETDAFTLYASTTAESFVEIETLQNMSELQHYNKDNISLKCDGRNILISYTHEENSVIKPHNVLYKISNDNGNLIIENVNKPRQDNLVCTIGNRFGEMCHHVFQQTDKSEIKYLKFDWEKGCYVDKDGKKYFYGGK